jgi:hypothetical protein
MVEEVWWSKRAVTNIWMLLLHFQALKKELPDFSKSAMSFVRLYRSSSIFQG